MADTKISALPPATTPLTGAELVPVVQSGATDRVAVSDLTAGRSVAASGLAIDANSAGAAVRITQTGAGAALLVEDSASTDSTPFVIDASGNMGVGTATPTTVANIYNATNASVLVQGDSATSVIANRSSTDTTSPVFILRKARGTTAAPTAVTSGDVSGNLNFQVFGGTNNRTIGFLRCTVSTYTSDSDISSTLALGTSPAGSAAAVATMQINSAGLVGINATPSLANLQINPSYTSTVTNGAYIAGTVQSTATSMEVYRTQPSTAAAAFTLSNMIHFSASQGSIGATSAVTNQFGYYTYNNLTGATNNYGFYGSLASGTGRWNFYAGGTANNAYAGNSRFGGVTAPVATVDVTGNVAATTSILSTGATSGIGYATGAGGAVTQDTSRTTGVTLNKVCGAITLFSAAGSATYATFTVTNSAVAATDTIIVNQKSGTDKYIILVTKVAAGSFDITFATTGGTTTEQPVFNFAVIKAVAA